MSIVNSDSSSSFAYVCQRCTACCRWPGDVRIDDHDIVLIAHFLNMSEQEFIDKYTRIHSKRDGLSLIEKSNDECIFLVEGKCYINDVKPQQCKDFPNKWNFPGWEKLCKAKWLPVDKDWDGVFHGKLTDSE